MVFYSRPWIAGLIGLVLLFAVSCSGGGGDPIAPSSISPGDVSTPGLTPGTPGSQGQPSGAQAHTGQSTGLWGIYDISYDPASNSVVVVPIRSAQFTLNVLGFVQPPGGNPANLGVQITDKSHFLDEGKLTLEVRITHPIDIPRIVGFDTLGVVIGDGSIPFNEDPGVLFAGADDLRLLNFDGYTRWMNPVEFTDPGVGGYIEGVMGTKNQDWTATVNPYKYFAEGLGPSDDLGAYLDDPGNQDLRGAFLPNTSNTREYLLQFPMSGGFPELRFQYAIISHFQGAKDDQGDPIPEPEISDFPASANAHEAIYIVPDTSGSTLYYNEATGASGGDLYVQLTIYDWQGMEVLGGAGVFDEVNSFGLDSPNGLFTASGLNIAAGAAGVTEITSGPNSSTVSLLVEGLEPATWGPHILLIAVYSSDPPDYSPNLGSAHPDARLAGYTWTIVNVEKKSDALNDPPVIEEIQGPTEVSCWTGDALYTCIASDPNGDDLRYTWEVVPAGEQPLFVLPYSDDNTATVDWSDEFKYPPGKYEFWFKVTDGELNKQGKLDVTKTPTGLLVHEISAEDDDTYDVRCTNIDALYTVNVESCDPTAEILCRWLRGPGAPPTEIDPGAPGWSVPSPNDFMVYSWDNTVVGPWWIIVEANDSISPPQYSPHYIVDRIDTPPEDVNPPIGATEVDCNSTEEVYELTGGDDCDGGENQRQWTITQTNDPPVGGWVNAPGGTFTVNWSVYPMGTYYAWQRVGSGGNYSVSDSLEISRVNTGPDTPEAPEGPNLVDCNDVGALYQAGVVGDCEGDPLTRQWALGTTPEPPATGWVGFTGTTFTVDYSVVASGDFFLYQRASDDEIEWNYSQAAQVTKLNAPPDPPDIPDGPPTVTCYDTAAEYDGGTVSDCDVGDILTRYYNVSFNPDVPTGDWVEFSGNSFFVDWSGFRSDMWYVFQRVFDGKMERIGPAFAVMKGNSPPEVGAPTGLTDVDCTSNEIEYTEGTIVDCDPFTEMSKEWYLSEDPDIPTGGHWEMYEGPTFLVNYVHFESGDYYLFTSANDKEDNTISEPLHIVRHNTAPAGPDLKPDIPEGPTEVDCVDNPAAYSGGEVMDCDPFDIVTRFHYLSTDPLVPSGGIWLEDFIGNIFYVDFTGVVAEQEYYIFQKASDGELETLSNSLAVVYHNTAPEIPARPEGKSNPSCANDNEEYQGGLVADCDTWQTFSRSWALNVLNWPPSTGWTNFTGQSWFIDWSLYDQGTYYQFQRVYDGYSYTYSTSLEITVGPPTFEPLDPPAGAEDVWCTGSMETYDAGEYLPGCQGIDIVREWAFSAFPSPPTSGWVEFEGTTFDVDPVTLGFGYVYLYQRATLDAQQETSDALAVLVHPGSLGVPPIPVGPTTVDCESTDEEYQMGSVTVECPGTPVDRHYQVQTTLGDPLMDWQIFTESPVTIDWTSFPTGETYHLVQRAMDGDHTNYSNPLVVTFTNYEPDFLGSITGPTAVTCTDTHAAYDGDEVYDCDGDQVLVREWAPNSINAYPVSGWETMLGSGFTVDYSDPSIQPGNVYLFQRVSDGIVTVYDPVSLHVTYTNSPPDIPPPPNGEGFVDCNNLFQTYDAGPANDCDGSPLIREVAMNQSPVEPTTGWVVFTGDTFDVDWTSIDYGVWFLWQRVSDPDYTSTSLPFRVLRVNSEPEITSFTCDEGPGPFNSDGETEGLTGLTLVAVLHYSFTVDDCDGDDLDNYWAATGSTESPPQGDPAWTGPIAGTTFTANLGDFTSEAPGRLFVHLASDDGTNFVSTAWAGTINMWELVWLTTFAEVSDMWVEDDCVHGAGSYSWAYDSLNEYLRLEDYGASSNSAVFGDPVSIPSAPGPGAQAQVITHINPALAEGLDNVNFSFLNDTTCNEYQLDIIFGNGCDSEIPELGEYTVPDGSPIWGTDRRVGIHQGGFDGCDPCNLWVDWFGFWIQPKG